MKIRFLRTVVLYFLVIGLTGCSSYFLKTKTEIPDKDFQTEEIPVSITSEESDSTFAEESTAVDYYEEEDILSRILEYYDEALNAFDDGDYGFAETKLDSAAVLSTEIDPEKIEDESLTERINITLASLFREYGRIFNDVDRINRENPMAWLEELSMTDSEQFRNGKWDDDELRSVVQKIALRCDVPIDYNDQVKKSIYFFQTVKREEMAKWQRRSGRYLKLIQDILDEEELPLDIAYLSMIESGFSSKAYSRARASGLWQFIYSTGRLYGLKRTQWLDERRDPVKATRAAVHHLSDLYKMYGDWRLVMAAYNCGPSRVTRQHRSGNSDFWSMRLPRETRNYVPSFMAAVVISKAPELFGFEGIETEPPMEFDTVEVSYTNLTVAAKCAGVDLQEIKNLNTELLKNYTPAGTTYPLKIPKGTKERFLTEYEKIPKEKYVPPRVDIYYVKRGDTLSEIAEKLKVSVRNLMAANNIHNPRALRVGQRLKITGTASVSTYSSIVKLSPQTVAEAKKNSFKYIVKRNDSLWLIARRNDTNISMLQALNDMGSRTRIVPGQTILVPRAVELSVASKPTASVNITQDTGDIIYIIKKNDTLYEIAQKYNVSHKDIMEWNKIKNHRKIRPGQKIIIKKK